MVDYRGLEIEYSNDDSLMAKKMALVDNVIVSGNSLLDVGVGTGELLEREKDRFEKLIGIDLCDEAISHCKERFSLYPKIEILKTNLNFFRDERPEMKFDCITCLDVLEHIKKEECHELLNDVYSLLNNNGVFIFTGPGVFEKIRIAIGCSPTHKHSHSSYGWKRMIEKSGFKVSLIQAVEFPLFHYQFLKKHIHVFGECCMIVAVKEKK